MGILFLAAQPGSVSLGQLEAGPVQPAQGSQGTQGCGMELVWELLPPSVLSLSREQVLCLIL